MTKPIILLDIDDTLNKFGSHFWELNNKLFNEKVDHNLVNEWELDKFSNRGKEVYELFKYPGLFRNIPLKENAKEFVESLGQFAEIYIVSDSPSGNESKHGNGETGFSNPADDKRLWVAENLPSIPKENIIFCSCKWMIEGDILVDDKPETYYKYRERNRDIILIDMPYNRHIDTKWRAKDLKQAKEMIYKILKLRGKIAA
ncbi:5' nucleotidase, NT5C type [Bacillus toyonensis]|uniref:5' nucleotidase, NT5C type n=1 Tax=Bacillus toyonensis TaxID=155322 RepID=UPI002E24EFA4|nr:hypothetical protein [Bacillus toyonensis]